MANAIETSIIKNRNNANFCKVPFINSNYPCTIRIITSLSLNQTIKLLCYFFFFLIFVISIAIVNITTTPITSEIIII